ncbi:MAG TPA: hypothetical protein VM736_11900, partial [Gemmatimonadales bacterium]|nr:hypothetical protein [Gemmatimonadales bacterium]
MLRRLTWFTLPVLGGLTVFAARVIVGPQRDGTTLLPSGWRLRPAGRAVPVGTLPLGLVILSDGSLVVSN